ncbi:MAG: hypothetical protein M5R36_16470 [Deltaproteobacteria bacterium]|nr:hypothetical protein [Deltaproteobacteria bacterium]
MRDVREAPITIPEHILAHLSGGLDRNDVREFVREHVGQPVGPAAQGIVEVGGPQGDAVHGGEGPTVGVIFGVEEDHFELGAALRVVVELGVVVVDVLGDLEEVARRHFHFGIVVNDKVLGFDVFPVDFGVVDPSSHRIQVACAAGAAMATHRAASSAIPRVFVQRLFMVLAGFMVA